MRRPLIALLLLGHVFCATSMADAGAIYKMGGSGIKALDEYHILELTFEGVRIYGQVRPLRGYTTPIPIEVTGNNLTEGVLELTFHLSKPETRTFKKSSIRKEVHWSALWRGSDGSDYDLYFWRPLQGEHSDATLTLNSSECGPLYRTLSVSFEEGTSNERLSQFITGNPDVAQIPVKVSVKVGGKWVDRRLLLGALLQKLWRDTETYRNSDERSDDMLLGDSNAFDVPVGTEATVVLALRGSGLMRADLGLGGCGGGDLSIYAHDRSHFFDGDTFLKDKFVASIEDGLRIFAGKDSKGQVWSYKIENQVVSTLPVLPFTSSYRAKLRVASEISRRIPGLWDTFEVAFEPTDLISIKRGEYGMVVTVAKLSSTSRSTGQTIRFRPHRTEGGRSVPSEYGQATAEITTALLVFMSRRVKDGWCSFVDLSVSPTKMRCGRSS